MNSPPRRHRQAPTLGLLRVLACYLCVILLLQGLTAAFALGAGPLHRHQETPALAPLAFSHHGHAHTAGERHHHDAVDVSVVSEADLAAALDEAALALAAALALLAIDTPRQRHDNRRHIWRARPAWFCSLAWHRLLFRPPRIA